MTSQEQIKQHIIILLDSLPDDRLEEVADYVAFLTTKPPRHLLRPYTPVALGGLWPDTAITDEDIATVRDEMWRDAGERTP
jgi:hypothetical protein